MSIKAVMFDLDDTLLWDERSVQEAFEATCEEAVKANPQIDAKQLHESVRKEARELYGTYPTYPFTQMIGINPFEALWGNFRHGEQQEFRQLQNLVPGYRTEAWTRALRAVGVEDAALGERLGHMFSAERRNRAYVYEETFQILKELKGHVKLLLLTNGCPDLQQEKIDGVPDLIPYFDHIVISGTFGEGKPAASIFHHALSKLEIQPEEALMVGDKLTTDIKGSLGVGIHSVWVNRYGVANETDINPEFEIKHLSEIHSIMQQCK